MKTKLHYYLFVLSIVLEMSFSFSQTIQLGTGTATNGTTASSPVNIWYRRTVAQFVYTAAELNAAGINGPCDLQDLGWYVTQSPIYNIPGYTVKVKHVGANNVAAALGTTGWTTIKGTFTYNPTAGGWDMLGLDNTFTWNGTDNIGVEVCWSQVQPSYSGSGQCRIYSNTSGYRYSWSDATGSSCGLSPLTINTNKPQVQMTWGCAPPCSTPVPPSISSATVNCGDQATLTASGAPSNGDYIWYDDPNGTNQVGTGSSFTTPALSGNTTYYVSTFVPANCESSLTAVTVNVNSNVSLPSASNINVDCGDPATLTASGSTGNYEWFSDVNGNSSIGTGNSLSLGNIFADSTVYVAATSGGSVSTSTDVYDIDLNDLLNVGSGDNNTRYSCGNNGQGFDWTDATPTGATITNVTIEFKIGVECAPGNKTSSLNSVAQPNFNSAANHCSTASPGPGSFITLNINPADYSIGANNVFSTGGHGSCFGFERSATLANYFARVTVQYEQGTQGCLSSLVAVTATANPLANPILAASPATICENGTTTLTASGAPLNGDYIWYNDPNGSNQIGTGPSYTSGNLTTTTSFYVQTNDGSGSGNGESLTTTFAAGNGQNGNMFNINVLDDITITDFDVHQYAGQTGNFEVYYKTGMYNGFEGNAGAWTLIGTANSIASNGQGNPTPLGLNLNLQLQSGAHAFYITSTNTNVYYTNGTNNNNIYVQNNEIELFEGVGKQYPFGGTYSPRIWNGTIHYEVGGGLGACFSSIETITVNIDQQPIAPSVSGAGSYCLGEEVVLSEASGNLLPAQLEWYENNINLGNLISSGTSSITVTPGSSQDYILVANSANGACPPAASNQANVSVPSPNNIIAPNNSTATCTVNQNGWVHLLDNNGRLIASVNSLGQNLGSLSATMYEESSPLIIEACNTPFIGYQTSVMDRHWVITPDIQPSQPVLVRLPFENTTLQSLIQESGTNQNPNDDVGSITDVFLSKYSGPQNIDNDFENNCVQNGGSGDVQLYNQNFNNSVPTMALLNGHPTSDLFAEFEVPNFSEFWLHGTNTFSPLPVTLTQFKTICKEDHTLVIWETETENNNSRFELEKSIDGQKWDLIYTQTAVGNSQDKNNYFYTDSKVSNEISYYRLKQFDLEGDYTFHGPISANCKFEIMTEAKIQPNPNNGNFTLNLIKEEGEIGEISINILSNTGKLMYHTTNTYNTNNQQINFSDLNLVKGAYLIQVVDRLGSFKTVKLIIT